MLIIMIFIHRKRHITDDGKKCTIVKIIMADVWNIIHIKARQYFSHNLYLGFNTTIYTTGKGGGGPITATGLGFVYKIAVA